MASKLGNNEEQVRRFIDAAHSLSSADIQPVVAVSRGPEVRSARSVISVVPRTVDHSLAIESAALGLVRDVRAGLLPSTTDAERITVGSFSVLLRSAVFALALRTSITEETVAHIVDPFAERLGFEWRSSGERSRMRSLWDGEPDLSDADTTPEPNVDYGSPAWAARIAAGISEELGDRERQQLARFLDPDYSARIEDDEPETMFEDRYDSYEHRFSLGAEIMYGLGYLSFPVSTGLVDYEEYYALSDEESERFRKDPELALPLLDSCRRREQDGRLMQQLPTINRGTPV